MNGCTGSPVHLLNLNNQEDKNNLRFTINFIIWNFNYLK
jgi:hypothetical protein